jgi:hypothetical protein
MVRKSQKNTKKLYEEESLRLSNQPLVLNLGLVVLGLVGATTYLIWYVQSGITARSNPESINDIFQSYVIGILPYLVLLGIFLYGAMRLLRPVVRPGLYTSVAIPLFALGLALGVILFVQLDMSTYFSVESGRTIFSF